MPVIETWSDEDVEVDNQVDGQEADAVELDAEPEVEPETEAAEDVAPPAEPEPAAAASYDQDFRIRIWNAEMKCRGREAVVEDLKEQLKAAKSDYEDAVDELRRLANDAYRPMPLFDNQEKAGEAFDPGEAMDQPLDESWRSRNFVEFIRDRGISGLGQKKLDALAEAVPTFGDFEDLRTRASKENSHLSKLMPDGFGPKVTDEIEEEYLQSQWNDSVQGDDLPEVDDSEPDFDEDPIEPEDVDLDSL
jgi:hypothetical protein